ncbi:MAG: hypothetical protein AAF587_33135 [Bacteroidota bacterium]
MRFSSLICFVLIMSLLPQLNAQAFLSRPEVKKKIHEFDFWLGEWIVYKTGTDTVAGYSHIQSILDSVGLQEHYKAVSGQFHGTSINKYNFAKQQWEQFWVDNSGLSLHIQGNREDNKMVLGNTAKTLQGSTIYNRISWHDNEDQTVRQVWEQSPDGEEWTKVFDGTYRRKK